MLHRILTLPLEGNNSIFLFGPRGTGKTYWIKTHLKDTIYLDLLDFATYSSLAANPGRLESLIPAGYTNWIVIDEVQRVPELLNEVHKLIEHKKYKFLLTASSVCKLKKRGPHSTEWGKRALRYNMHTLVIQELGDAFNMEQVLQYGLLPAAVGHADPARYLESYVQTYVKEEVLQEGLTRNVGAFTKFLEIASFSQGQLLNISEISRELGLSRITVANYFDILEDLLLASRISAFSQRAKRKIIAHQKFYFFDTGVYRSIRPMGPLDSRPEAEGVALETLFLQSVQAINDYYNLGYTISFWRTLNGDEVDFILYGPKGFHAFEIKRSSKIESKSLRGLKSFGEDYPEASLYIIYLGKEKEYHGNIQAIGMEQVLRELPTLLG